MSRIATPFGATARRSARLGPVIQPGRQISTSLVGAQVASCGAAPAHTGESNPQYADGSRHRGVHVSGTPRASSRAVDPMGAAARVAAGNRTVKQPARPPARIA